ncbi:MAG: DUF2057 family protein [Oleiphilaceae bacterium]|nr:DUF2057 family protein [Oleiphilaceae bacterium]
MCAASLLFACSHWPTAIPTWPDQALDDAVSPAQLSVPGHLKLLRVDGRDLPDYLMQSTSFHYQLLPGERQLLVRHDSLWALALGEGGERVQSEPVAMTVTLEEGGRYSLATPSEPRSLRQARAMARCGEVRLMGPDGTLLHSKGAECKAGISASGD